MSKHSTHFFIDFVRQRISAYQVFQLFRFSSLLLPGILLAQAAYSKEEIGLFETFLLSTSSISFFWVSALFTAMLSTEHKGADRIDLVRHTWLLSLGLSAMASVGFILFSLCFSAASLSPLYLLFFVLYMLTNNPSFSIENKLLLLKEDKKLVGYGAIFFIIQTLCPLLVILLKGDAKDLIVAITLFSIIRFLVSYFLLFTGAPFQFRKPLLLLLFTAALPLALSYFMSGGAEYIDAYLVSHYFGKGELGVYRYGAREFPVFLLLANSLSISMIPIIAQQVDEGVQTLKKRSLFLMHLSFPIMILLVLCSRWLYPLVFNQNFAPAATYFNWYALLLISRLVFPQTILMALQKNKIVLLSACMELGINVGLSLYLLPSYGILGIIWATLIAYTFDKLFLVVYCSQLLKIKINAFVPVKALCIYSLLLLAAMTFIMLLK